jgi:hypothetical protein
MTTSREEPIGAPLPALEPDGPGHRFVLYGDACSGVPAGRHETTFAAVNAVVRRLVPPPEFIVFTGDEIAGLTPDRTELEAQWRHWLDHEMAWLDRSVTPMWHATGNHTTYDAMSEAVFRDVLAMPGNGPPGQDGLSYWVRRGDLLLVVVHTLWSGLGGEGFVETGWLDRVLVTNADCRHKLVVGHHPVYPVNGYSGPCQREIDAALGAKFWQVLVRHSVTAYVCSHILAFDVQVHAGVLQICTAGAGTAHRMPDDVEYLHCVQMALDRHGLRYQVLDTNGAARETLDWPTTGWPVADARALGPGSHAPAIALPPPSGRLHLTLTGTTAHDTDASAETLFCGSRTGALPPLWIGLRGPRRRLTAIIHHAPARSPHYWLGPELTPGEHFSMELLLHWDMGPGGLLYRTDTEQPWTSMSAASPWGLERMANIDRWHRGRTGTPGDPRPFRGDGLEATIGW